MKEFSLEELQHAFSGIGQAEAIENANKLKDSKDAILGGFWHTFKVLQGDYDRYSYYSQSFLSSLHNGAITGLLTPDGKPVYQWKPVKEQLSICQNVMKGLNITPESAQKFCNIHRERVAKYVNQSGTYEERNPEAGVNKPYARTDNENAIEEMELRREIAKLRKENSLESQLEIESLKTRLAQVQRRQAG